MAAAALAAHAQSEPAPQVGEAAADPRPWLLRIHDAAAHQNFQGTFVATSMGAAVSSAHILHFSVGSNQFERIESQDGPQREVFRHNQTVHTFWPDGRVALIEQRALLTSFPAVLQGDGDHIADHYEIALQGHDRVAGHLADVLRLKPRDALRFGYRLWAEHRSGLLLRADVIGERGEVLESSAFSDVVIGVKPQPAAVLQPMNRLDGFRVVTPALTPMRLESEGWNLHEPVAGFQLVDCVRRQVGESVSPVVDNGQAPSRSKVIQAIFADGLTYVSVFIEPYDANRHTRAMMTSIGATQTMMRRQGDVWITLVGDVPPATLKAFSSALERKQ